MVPSMPGGDGGEHLMGLPLRDAREVFEREYLVAQISRFGGNISRTAEFVGMERLRSTVSSRRSGSTDQRRAIGMGMENRNRAVAIESLRPPPPSAVSECHALHM